jgi:predicted aminopeptidase
MRKWAKRVSWALLLLGLAGAVWQRELVGYGLAQGYGQAKILWQARPVSQVLNDPQVPDSVKVKLKLIAEIKQFAEDSLGLRPSDNYTTFYDQGGRPVLWVLTACAPFALHQKEWDFPLIGSFSYKGFFDLEKAKKEQAELDAQGLDTQVNTVSGWSTLGWFKDPVLSNFLRRPEGDLASLIIHELTHGTLFVKDSLQLNENLATFVGDQGAVLFLRHKYGPTSPQLRTFLANEHDRLRFTDHVLRGTQSLDSLYKSLPPDLPKERKLALKTAQIGQITRSLDTIPFQGQRYRDYFGDFEPNNNFFMGYVRYEARQNELEVQFERDFSRDFHRYWRYLKGRYKSL